jgi:hypothetical protein
MSHAGGNPGTRLQPMPAGKPTPRPSHGNPDRLPVWRLAVVLARLPVIAPGTARCWRRCRLVAGCTDREDEDPEELPVFEHPEILTRPRNARSAAVALPRLRTGPLASDRPPVPPDTGAVVASWPASPIERAKTRPNCR